MRPSRPPILRPRFSVPELRSFGTFRTKTPLNSCLSKPQERASSNKGKHVTFLTSPESASGDDAEVVTSSELNAHPLKGYVAISPSLDGLSSSSPSLRSISSSEGLPKSIFASTSPHNRTGSDSSFDSDSSVLYPEVFLHTDADEPGRCHASPSPVSAENTKILDPDEQEEEDSDGFNELPQPEHKPSMPAMLPMTHSLLLRSRGDTPSISAKGRFASATSSERAAISPFEEPGVQSRALVRSRVPLVPEMLGVLPDLVPDSPSNPHPVLEPFPALDCGMQPTPSEKPHEAEQCGSPLELAYSRVDFPTYGQEAVTPTPQLTKRRSRLGFFRRYSSRALNGSR
jgi:hypothetical protein